ncbi:MAG TPA: DUF2971 domain-containing protein [Massilibacterium sp.]|nr:DUF2971 domain-containing protein [Massilibacterium sp.]
MLYKYLPFERVDVLESLSIRFSPLGSLNDPFECQPLIDMRNEKSVLINEIIDDLNNLWSRTDEKEKTLENKKILEDTKQNLINRIKAKTDSYAVGQELMSLLGDNLGVLSLSRTNSSLLMWSHYASEGKGIVLGLNDEHSFFRQRDMKGDITRPIPVVYTDKRRKIAPGEDRYYEKLLCEKPIDWAYEEEERLFRTFLTKSGSIGQDDYGQDIILCDLPKEVIKAIYIGYRADEKTKERASSAIKKNGIDCTMYGSEICRDEYRLNFSKIEIT